MSSTPVIEPPPSAASTDRQPPHRFRPWAGLLGGLGLFLAFLLLPAPEDVPPAAWRTAAVGALMAVWWMTEALPLAATALVPLVLFPLLEVADFSAAAAPYANPLIFLFMGGFLLAMAMERWALHRRLALSIINRMGTRPLAIIAGFMTATAFLSMWVSNTATAMMMLPIGLSVVELVRHRTGTDAEQTHFAIVLMLVIAYGSSIGGIGTLIGTPTNALLAGFMAETYDVEISFVGWMQLGLTLVVVALPLVFLLLTKVIFPIRLREIPGGRAFIQGELRALGPMSRPEKAVAAVFVGTAVLWIVRPLLGGVLPALTDAGVAMTSALLLFILPANLRRGTALLDWEHARRLPWGVLLLFGGGLSLAAAIQETGLAAWIGEQMALLGDLPLIVILLAVVTVVTFLTELTSNTATAAAFLPVLASVSLGIGQDPLWLGVPAALAASCAFMMPVATPPNAIVYGSSFVTIRHMARAGFVLNLLFIVLITLLTAFLLPRIFDLGPATP